MWNPRYALVSYVRSPAGQFVEDLRQQLHPELPHISAHVTLLPPRLLCGSETSALQTLEEICSHVEPFEVELGDVGTFVPKTPTVFIRLVEGSARMRELHEAMNTKSLNFCEDWPYTPHMTIAKLTTESTALEVFRTASERWAEYTGSKRIRLESLTFVKESTPNCWVDLASVALGTKLVRG